MPLPSEETTPPVMNTYRVMGGQYTEPNRGTGSPAHATSRMRHVKVSWWGRQGLSARQEQEPELAQAPGRSMQGPKLAAGLPAASARPPWYPGSSAPALATAP